MEIKKKNYLLGALLCVLPCVVLLLAQTVGSIIPSVKWNNIILNEIMAENPNIGIEELTELTSQRVAATPEIVTELTLWSMTTSAVVLALWFILSMMKRDLGIIKTFTGKKMGQAVLLGCAAQGLVTFAVSLLSMVLPNEAGESYSELMDRLVDIKNPAIIISLVVLAPIAEEFAFRGLTLNYAKEYFGEKMAIVISSLMFAAVHLGNGFSVGVLIQVAYALCIGIVFAIVTVKYKSIWITVIMHMVVNGLAAVLSYVQLRLGDTEEASLVIFGSLLLLGIGGAVFGGILFAKTPKETRLTVFENQFCEIDDSCKIDEE